MRPEPRPVWIWPLRVPRRFAAGTWRATTLGDRIFAGWLWFPVALAVGALPVAAAFGFGGSWHQSVTAILLFALFLAALRGDHMLKGLGVIAAVFLAHMAVAIALTRAWPEQAAACFPGSEAYWAKQERWITTGNDPEYRLSNWVPAHFQLLGAMAVLSYVSLGFVPFLQGFHEVDLMNYYVGRLVETSSSETIAVSLGWHFWSLMRGVCYAVLVFEIASWSLSRLTGQPLSTRRRRVLRWSAALVFFSLDCVFKLLMVEPVRQRLQDNLIAGV